MFNGRTMKWLLSKLLFRFSILPSTNTETSERRFQIVTVVEKVKFALEQAMKAQMGSRCVALLFL